MVGYSARGNRLQMVGNCRLTTLFRPMFTSYDDTLIRWLIVIISHSAAGCRLNIYSYRLYSELTLLALFKKTKTQLVYACLFAFYEYCQISHETSRR
jgi:hypothetical protein